MDESKLFNPKTTGPTKEPDGCQYYFLFREGKYTGISSFFRENPGFSYMQSYNQTTPCRMVFGKVYGNRECWIDVRRLFDTLEEATNHMKFLK